jgi:hypothetical protein
LYDKIWKNNVEDTDRSDSNIDIKNDKLYNYLGDDNDRSRQNRHDNKGQQTNNVSSIHKRVFGVKYKKNVPTKDIIKNYTKNIPNKQIKE